MNPLQKQIEAEQMKIDGKLKILIILAEAVYMSDNKRDIEIGDKMLSEIHDIQHSLCKQSLPAIIELIEKDTRERIVRWVKENKREYAINPVNDPIVYIDYDNLLDNLKNK